MLIYYPRKMFNVISLCIILIEELLAQIKEEKILNIIKRRKWTYVEEVPRKSGKESIGLESTRYKSHGRPRMP